jgi:hypothetical protein
MRRTYDDEGSLTLEAAEETVSRREALLPMQMRSSLAAPWATKSVRRERVVVLRVKPPDFFVLSCLSTNRSAVGYVALDPVSPPVCVSESEHTRLSLPTYHLHLDTNGPWVLHSQHFLNKNTNK